MVVILYHVGFKELQVSTYGDGVGGGGQQQGVAGAEGLRRAVLVDNGSRSFGGNEYDEGVECAVVESHGAVDVVDGSGEEGTAHHLVSLILVAGIVCAIVVAHAVVYRLSGQLGVQLAGIAVGVAAAKVVDAVGDVAGLLNFDDEASGADGVYAAGGNEEDVALDDVVAGQGVADGVVGHPPLVLRWREAVLQPIVDEAPAGRRQGVPHLVLAVQAPLQSCGLIVGMHLYGEVLLGIDELYEQRKFVAEAAVVSRAH